MASILEKILADKAMEVERTKAQKPLPTVRAYAETAAPALDFFAALSNDIKSPRVIAECKRQSPSRGVMVQNYEPGALAQSYARGGAAAISVLTDGPYFGGALSHLHEVVELVSIPVLRKDFIIDEYQIYEARAAGASTYLLLAGVLPYPTLQYFIEVGRDLGMEPLVESHTKEELTEALRTDAKILGINNRDLKSFHIDLNHSKELVKMIAADKLERLPVCESGIRTAGDIAGMLSVGYNAFLVGESLATAADPESALRALLSP